MRHPRILDTVGLWGTPINKFRVFKVGDWHIVWPNETFARERADSYAGAIQALHRAIAEANRGRGFMRRI